jgi:hypothetical protein
MRAATSRLQKKQNKIVRNLFGRFFPNCGTTELFDSMKILRIKQIYKLHLGLTMYKVIYTNQMPFLESAIQSLLVNHRYPTRRHSDLIPPLPRVNAIKFNFLYQSILFWNSLPEDIKSCSSLFVFKKKLVGWIRSAAS